MSRDNVKRERWVYAGQVLDTRGKLFHKWWRLPEGDQPLDSLPPLDEQSDNVRPAYIGGARNLVPGRPGMVYAFDIEVSPTGEADGILGENREYLGTWPHHDQVTGWQLRHDHEGALARTKKQAKKERGRNFWQERLDPVRDLYRNTRTVDRAALLAMIVEYITRP